jgi:AcrR family transcriptional regulator
VRTALVERAAEMLARHEPVTLRALVAGTGASTMAVYTHFSGMPGLWRAVRQEGFTRLAARLALIERTDDPVRDLSAAGAAYIANALANPALYRAMFDTTADLEEPATAAETFHVMVSAAARAREEGRFAPDSDPDDIAVQLWAAGHGLSTLVISGLLHREALHTQAPALAVALFRAAGDREEACRRSVIAGWSTLDDLRPPGSS